MVLRPVPAPPFLHRLSRVSRLTILSLLVGLVAGLGAIVFNLALSAGTRLFLDGMAGYRQPGAANEHEILDQGSTAFSPWMLPVVATIGGLLSGLLVWWTAREASGHGTDAAIDAYHNKEGRIRLRVPIIKIVASALTLGSGGSGGREGPIAQIGAGFGSYLGTALGLSDKERRILLAAGIGAGVGSIFHAPLAGALFAVEVFYSESEFEADGLIPAAVATIVGYSVFSLWTGFEPLFDTPDFRFHTLWELVPFTVLAAVVTLAAALFVFVFYGCHNGFERSRKIPDWAKPMVGAMATGLIGLSLFSAFDDSAVLDVLSFGYGTLQDGLLGDPKITVPILLAIALGKILTTSLSIGSGGSGGVFGPSMVIGGCTGGVVGLIGNQWFPEVIRDPGAYILVGMAGFFTAAAKTPISTIVMVSEMTGNYHLLVPSLWVAALAVLFGRRIRLYRSQVPTRLQSNAHKDEMFVDVLEGMTVADVMDSSPEFETVRRTTSLQKLVTIFTETTQHYFPVLDDDDRMVAILSANDVRRFVQEQGVGTVVIADDIAVQEVVTVTASTPLEQALNRFVSLDVDSLPIVEEDDDTRVITMLGRRQVMQAYQGARADWIARREK
eukprot:jgi/Undpi1/11718/HiC_scaffold_37.g14013.m1